MNKAKIIIAVSGSGSVFYMLDRGNWKYDSFGVDRIRDLRKAVGDAEVEFAPCTFADGTELDPDVFDEYSRMYYEKFVCDPETDMVIDEIRALNLKGDYKLYFSDTDTGKESYLYVDSIYDAIIHIMFYYDIPDIHIFMSRILADAERGKLTDISDRYDLGTVIRNYDGHSGNAYIVSW